MTQHREATREPLGVVLSQLRTVLQRQAEALNAEDFDGLDGLDAEREQLVAALGGYTAADTQPQDRELIQRVGALDQRLISIARESLERTAQDLREVHRGRGALNVYRQRGQATIHGLAHLDPEG